MTRAPRAAGSENGFHVIYALRRTIEATHDRRRKMGLCGQAASERLVFARFLVDAVIDSVSVNPDTLLRVKRHVAAAETGHARDEAETT